MTGLRGIAAASVVLYHVWLYGAPGAETFPAGAFETPLWKFDLGVTFFFVLSGLLLYRPYARAILSDASLPQLRDFAIARFLRIVPIYWGMVLVVAALFERQLFSDPWRLLANLLFLEFAFPSFLPEDFGPANGSIAIVPSWALVVEMGFYITLPLLCFLAAGLAVRSRRRVLAVLVPSAILAVVGAGAIAVEHSLSGDVRRAWQLNFPMHASAFAFGMAATTLWVLWEQGAIRLPRGWRLPTALGALAIGLVSAKLANTDPVTLADARASVAISYSLLLLLVVFSPGPNRLHAILGARPLVAVGLASYSIFLIHDPVIRSLRTHGLVSVSLSGFILTLAIVCAVTGVLATVSYRCLEKPSFALKRRLVQREPVKPLRELLERLVTDVDAARVPEFTFDVGRTRSSIDAAVLTSTVGPIVENAIAYGAAPYALRAHAVDGKLQVIVEDSGRGVDEGFVPVLFEPHTRSEQSSRLPGEGLGLSEATSSAREHGGVIAYESPATGGARFTVTLPLPQNDGWAQNLARATRRWPARRGGGLTTKPSTSADTASLH